jgi:hypothetical protein
MKDIEKLNHFQKFQRSLIGTFPNFIQLKKEGREEEFNKLILKILPSLKKYINEKLDKAIKKGDFSKNKFKTDECIDQFIIEVYDHIEEVKNAKYFSSWIFKKIENLFEDIILEREFEEAHLINIDDYSKLEWDEMDEEFSTDGDGDLIPIDELDDSSYNKNDYTLNHVFIEDYEQDYIDKLDEELNK